MKNNKSHPTIEILLATFQSERFLNELLDSILAQTDTEWTLLIRDGGSTDSTENILQSYQAKYPDKIRILPGGRASACRNFAKLAEASSAELVMFCDHDDIWKPDKIELSRKAYEAETVQIPSDTPIMFFSDMTITDHHLKPIAKSFFRNEHIDPRRLKLEHLLLQNVPSGCTMLVNRSLLKRAIPIPERAVMHDHWLALCTACFGHFVYLPTQTLLYRQHSKNVFGASGYGISYFLHRIQQGIPGIRNRLFEKSYQAGAFLDSFRNSITEKDCLLLSDFASLPNVGWLSRREILWKHKIFKNGWIRNIGMFLLI